MITMNQKRPFWAWLVHLMRLMLTISSNPSMIPVLPLPKCRLQSQQARARRVITPGKMMISIGGGQIQIKIGSPTVGTHMVGQTIGSHGTMDGNMIKVPINDPGPLAHVTLLLLIKFRMQCYDLIHGSNQKFSKERPPLQKDRMCHGILTLCVTGVDMHQMQYTR